MHESREHGESREPAQQRRAGTGHEARVNQRRPEPLPASSGSDRDQPAAAGNQGQAVSRPEQPAEPGRGDAVRDMMGGPPPQGDVPDAPATQIAAADVEEGQGSRVRRVANAVPGQPDGEVDTRS